jgi:hypothetical protein
VAIDDDGEIKGAEEIQFSMSSSCEAMWEFLCEIKVLNHMQRSKSV